MTSNVFLLGLYERTIEDHYVQFSLVNIFIFFCWLARGAVLRPLEIRETLTSIPPMVPRTSMAKRNTKACLKWLISMVNSD